MPLLKVKTPSTVSLFPKVTVLPLPASIVTLLKVVADVPPIVDVPPKLTWFPTENADVETLLGQLPSTSAYSCSPPARPLLKVNEPSTVSLFPNVTVLPLPAAIVTLLKVVADVPPSVDVPPKSTVLVPLENADVETLLGQVPSTVSV